MEAQRTEITVVTKCGTYHVDLAPDAPMSAVLAATWQAIGMLTTLLYDPADQQFFFDGLKAYVKEAEDKIGHD